MFQSIKYINSLGYNKKTKTYSYEFELTDSDFGCVKVVSGDAAADEVAAVIQEYTKRNLNVAKNLILYFRWYEKQYGFSIAEQIKAAERYQPLFTPQIKADIERYMALL